MNQNFRDLNDKAIRLMSSDRKEIRDAGWLLWMLLGICDRLLTNATLLEAADIEDDRGGLFNQPVKIWIG